MKQVPPTPPDGVDDAVTMGPVTVTPESENNAVDGLFALDSLATGDQLTGVENVVDPNAALKKANTTVLFCRTAPPIPLVAGVATVEKAVEARS
jgi:hypothetical protein